MPDVLALDALPFFATLAAETRRRMAEAAIRQTYPAGATLFRAGTEPRGIYIVLAGRVRVTRSRDGRQYVVHTEGPGGTLAEVPLFEGGLLPATARASEPTECLVLTRAALESVMLHDPAVAWLFLRRLSTRLRELVERLDRASTQSVPARLAAFIITRDGAEGATPFHLGMTQNELAEELGTVREVVARSLARLRASGMIALAGRGRYVVRDRGALSHLAGS